VTPVEQFCLVLPDPLAEHWPAVRDYLARSRALDPALLV